MHDIHLYALSAKTLSTGQAVEERSPAIFNTVLRIGLEKPVHIQKIEVVTLTWVF